MSLSPGDKLGRYNILSAIGVGGMGEVYLAEDTSLERKVAIKILGKEFNDDAERLGRFVQEARSASALNHPNILTIYEITKEKDTNYIVSEYVEGDTVKRILKSGRPPLSKALDIAVQTASALATAHEAGIVHRDIKPANIMVRSDGLVKVLDFGIAKIVQTAFDQSAQGEAPTRAQIGTEPGVLIGTPRYMSPEQARGRHVDQRSDIFSFGLVLYELFSGTRAFEGEDTMDLVSAILRDEPAPISAAVPNFPAELEKMVTKTLRKDREQRYQNIRDLMIDLEDARDDLKYSIKTGGGGEETIDQKIHATEADPTFSTGKLSTLIVKERRFSILHALGFAALAVALVGGYFWYDSYNHAADLFSKDFKISEIATWSSAPGELSSTARFSPDGKLIAFSSTRSGTKDIWVMQSNSKEAIQITKDEFANTDPVWSPDGSEIAYFSDKKTSPGEGGPRTGIWRISALGGQPKPVGPIADGVSELRRWTKGGKIIFEARNELFTIDISNGQTEKLTVEKPPEGRVIWADASEDGQKSAFVIEKNGTWQILEGESGNANFEVLASRSSKISEAVWFPSSSSCFFSSPENGVDQIFAAAAGFVEAIQITNSVTGSSVVDVSSDSRSLLFSSSREDSNIWRADVGGKSESPVVQGISSELWPNVSPDGTLVVFQTIRNLDRGDKLQTGPIAVAKADKTVGSDDPLTVTDNGYAPEWSPNGDLIAFGKQASDGERLLVANPGGGGERLLASDMKGLGYSVSPYNRVQTSDFSWKSDGTGIAYVSVANNTENIWLAPIDGSGAKALTRFAAGGDSVGCPLFSPDGDRVAFYSQSKGTTKDGTTKRRLWTVDPADGKTEQVFESEEVIRLLGWSETGSQLIFAEASKFSSLPPEVILWRVNMDGTGKAEIARLKNAYFYNIFLSGDRKTLAYAAREKELDDIWLIPAGGGSAKKITNNNDTETYFSSLTWAPDGNAIYFGKQTRFSLLSMITNLKE